MIENIILLLILLLIFFKINENYNSCKIEICSSISTLSKPNGLNCCSNISNAISYTDNTCTPTCNINYTLSQDNKKCCSNMMGAFTYNNDCTINTYITEDINKVRLYGKINYIDLIGNFDIGNGIITDRLIYSAKIPSKYKVTFYNNSTNENITLTGDSTSYGWKDMNKVDILSNEKVKIYSNYNYVNLIGTYEIGNGYITSEIFKSI